MVNLGYQPQQMLNTKELLSGKHGHGNMNGNPIRRNSWNDKPGGTYIPLGLKLAETKNLQLDYLEIHGISEYPHQILCPLDEIWDGMKYG